MNFKDFVLKYNVLFRKKNSKNEKIRFLSSLGEDMSANGYKYELLLTRVKNRDCINLICGDIHKAEKIYVTHYDNPQWIPLMTKIRPFNDANLKLVNILFRTFSIILIALVTFSFYSLFAKSIFSDNMHTFIDVVSYGIMGCLLLLSIKVSKGIVTSKHIEDPISTLYTMYKLSIKNVGKKTAFVFVDYGNLDRFGYVTLIDYLKNELISSKIVFLDKIGSNEIHINHASFSSPLLKSISKNATFVGGGQENENNIVYQYYNSFDESQYDNTLDKIASVT